MSPTVAKITVATRSLTAGMVFSGPMRSVEAAMQPQAIARLLAKHVQIRVPAATMSTPPLPPEQLTLPLLR